MTHGAHAGVPRQREGTAPPRYKLAIVNWLAAYPLITFLLWAAEPVTGRLPVFVTTLLLSATLVCLMTFCVAPFMMRLFAPWLTGTDRQSRDEEP